MAGVRPDFQFLRFSPAQLAQLEKYPLVRVVSWVGLVGRLSCLSLSLPSVFGPFPDSLVLLVEMLSPDVLVMLGGLV